MEAVHVPDRETRDALIATALGLSSDVKPSLFRFSDEDISTIFPEVSKVIVSQNTHAWLWLFSEASDAVVFRLKYASIFEEVSETKRRAAQAYAQQMAAHQADRQRREMEREAEAAKPQPTRRFLGIKVRA